VGAINHPDLTPDLEDTIMVRTKTSKPDTSDVQASVDMLNEVETVTESRGVALLATVKTGAQAAQQAAAQVGPAVGNGLRAAAYQGIYSVAYGLTFGVLMAGKVIPVSGFITNAVNDGNSAAKVAFNEREARLQTQAEEAQVALNA
jgi:hypothetical protein